MRITITVYGCMKDLTLLTSEMKPKNMFWPLDESKQGYLVYELKEDWIEQTMKLSKIYPDCIFWYDKVDVKEGIRVCAAIQDGTPSQSISVNF